MADGATPELSHFLDLAYSGRNACASSGEKRARAIALVVLEHAGGLDAQALAGLQEFIDLAAHAPQTAERIIGPNR